MLAPASSWRRQGVDSNWAAGALPRTGPLLDRGRDDRGLAHGDAALPLKRGLIFDEPGHGSPLGFGRSQGDLLAREVPARVGERLQVTVDQDLHACGHRPGG